MRSRLEAEGHTILDARNANEGLRQFDEHAPDLIITAIFMPDNEGLGLIREIRLRQAKTKIIAISGGSRTVSADPLLIAEMLGAVDMLRKPFGRNKLFEAVCRVLRRSSAY